MDIAALEDIAALAAGNKREQRAARKFAAAAAAKLVGAREQPAESAAAQMAAVAWPVTSPHPPNYFPRIGAAELRVPLQWAAVEGQAASQQESNLVAVAARSAPVSPEMGPCPPNYFLMVAQRAEKAEPASQATDRRPPNYFPKIARAQAWRGPADRAKLLLASPARPVELAALLRSAQARAD